VSSHVLTELEQFIDTVTVLTGGEVVAAGPLDEVLSATAANRYAVDTSDNDRLADLLAGRESVDEIDRADDGSLVVTTDDPSGFAVALPQLLSEAGLGVYSVSRDGGLEARFLELLEDGGED
jgi:ABC-type multidrug transport system ATPase subunit